MLPFKRVWNAPSQRRRNRIEYFSAGSLEVIRSTRGMPLGAVQQPHRILGELNLYEWIAFLGTHEARHAAQIRELAATLHA